MNKTETTQPPLFRVWSKTQGKYFDDPTWWGDDLHHLRTHLFVASDGIGVYWLQYDGIKNISEECEVHWLKLAKPAEVKPTFPVLHDEYNCSRVYALLPVDTERTPANFGAAGSIFVSMDGNVTLNYAFHCHGADNSLSPETWAKLNAGMEYAYKLAAEKRAGVKHEPEQGH